MAVNGPGAGLGLVTLGLETDVATGAEYLIAQDSAVVADSNTTLYTCPAGRTACVRVKVSNYSAAAKTFTLYKVPSGEAAGSTYALCSDRSLAAKGAIDDYWEEGPLTMTAGDTIVAIASAAASLAGHVSGIEVGSA